MYLHSNGAISFVVHHDLDINLQDETFETLISGKE